MEKDSRNIRTVKFGLVAAATFAFLPLQANTGFMDGQGGLFFLSFVFLPPVLMYVWIKGTRKERAFYSLCWLGFFLVIAVLFVLMLLSISGL